MALLPPPFAPHRSIRIAIAALLGVLLVMLAAWGLSYVRLAVINHKFGSLVEPGGPHGEPAEWTFRARSINTGLWRGRFQLGLSEYRSYAPSREDFSNWSEWRGWTADLLPAASVEPLNHPAFVWRSPTDFMFLGLGTQLHSRQGEDTRLVSIPLWLVTISLVGAAFALWRPGHRRARRRSRGQCLRCGYSLAGVAPTAPCPECGAARA